VQIAQAFTASTDTQTVEETMTKPLTQIGNEVREMTDAEYAQWQADAAVAAAQEQAAADAAAARASALAKLAGLGLTADEIAALVGA
jgi:hypothetical protein